ncbi:MAG TPA: hypothetical protein VN436_14725 [Holophaga sp.]|nr:hypothetical protein [Holophaga sp.]
MGFRVEAWRDEHGVEWELVQLDDGGGCLIREGLSRLDVLDGDAREGVEVIARFADLDDARAFLMAEGFLPLT